MEDSVAAEVETEEQIDIPGHEIVNRSYGSFRPGAGRPVRAQEDHSPSASAEASAAPRKQPYRHKSLETSPLLTKVEDMSGQLSSPIEIAGIEGTDGAKRPWLRAKIQEKKPYWETASVRAMFLCMNKCTDQVGLHRCTGYYLLSSFTVSPWAQSQFLSST